MNEWHTFESYDRKEIADFLDDIEPDYYESCAVKYNPNTLKPIYGVRWHKENRLTDEQMKRWFPDAMNEQNNARNDVLNELNDLIHNSPVRIPKEVMEGLKHALDYIEKH